MKYLLDTHSLSNSLLEKAQTRNDLFVLREVADESAFSKQEVQRITSAGISIIDISKKHLEKLKDVLVAQGDNLKLIRLYTNEGTADIMMLAYIIAEKEAPETLFNVNDDYAIVTQDKELISIAKGFGIKCVTSVP